MTEGSPQKGSLGGVYTDLPMPRDTQWSGQKWAKRVDRTSLSQSPFPGLFDHFIIVWGIRTTYLLDHRLSRDLRSMLLLCTFT